MSHGIIVSSWLARYAIALFHVQLEPRFDKNVNSGIFMSRVDRAKNFNAASSFIGSYPYKYTYMYTINAPINKILV